MASGLQHLHRSVRWTVVCGGAGVTDQIQLSVALQLGVSGCKGLCTGRVSIIGMILHTTNEAAQ